jgi:uncharacterized membrane protein YeaQ/YmgE (transglycosylase-associated protein family)
MRRIALVLILLGVVGFLVASSQRSGYDSVEGALKTTFSKNERGKRDMADTGRWVALVVAAIGAVLFFVPERKG